MQKMPSTLFTHKKNRKRKGKTIQRRKLLGKASSWLWYIHPQGDTGEAMVLESSSNP